MTHFCSIGMLLVLLSNLAFAGSKEPVRLKLDFGLEEEYRPPGVLRSEALSRLKTPMDKEKLFSIQQQSEVARAKLRKANQRWMEEVVKWCSVQPSFVCQKGESPVVSILHRRDRSLVTEINFGYDQAALEVRPVKFSRAQLDGELGEIFENVLFRIPKKLKIKHAVFLGEGHIHIDFKKLFTNPDGTLDLRMYRNYVVDWVNHNELYYGALNYSPTPLKSNPLIQNQDEAVAFEKWLSDYDESMKKGSKKMTPDFFNSMTERLSSDIKFEKGRALNMGVENWPTIEVRSLRNKKSLTELKKTLALLEERANFLKNLKEDLPYYRAGAIQNSQEGVNRFYRYVTEAGLDWSDYRTFMPKTWQRLKPQELPDAELFRPGKMEPPKSFQCITWTLIHLLGK